MDRTRAWARAFRGRPSEGPGCRPSDGPGPGPSGPSVREAGVPAVRGAGVAVRRGILRKGPAHGVGPDPGPDPAHE